MYCIWTYSITFYLSVYSTRMPVWCYFTRNRQTETERQRETKRDIDRERHRETERDRERRRERRGLGWGWRGRGGGGGGAETNRTFCTTVYLTVSCETERHRIFNLFLVAEVQKYARISQKTSINIPVCFSIEKTNVCATFAFLRLQNTCTHCGIFLPKLKNT